MDKSPGHPSPQIVAFVADLMDTIRIEGAAKHLDYTVAFIGRADEVESSSEESLMYQPGEPLFGRLATLFDRITFWQPYLLIFDLANKAIPWQSWIAVLKSSPASRRIPILCYGPHVDELSLDLARNLDAECVVPRSRFMNRLPELLNTTARTSDLDAISEGCRESLAAVAVIGLEAFNRGDYFESHEYLEEAWNEDVSPAREVYRAILQVAVAYLQIERGNYRGAIKMFLRTRQWLAPLPDKCRGIDIAQLRVDSAHVYDAVVTLGPLKIGEFDHSLFQPVVYSSTT